MLPKRASDVEMQPYFPWYIFPFPRTQQIRSWTFCLVLVWRGLMGHVMHLACQTSRIWWRKGRPVLLQEHPSLPHKMRVVATTSWPMCLFWLPSCWVSWFMWLINGELSLCVGSSRVQWMLQRLLAAGSLHDTNFPRLLSAGDHVSRRGLSPRPVQLSWEHLQREKSSKVTAVFFWTPTAYRTTSPAKVWHTNALKLNPISFAETSKDFLTMLLTDLYQPALVAIKTSEDKITVKSKSHVTLQPLAQFFFLAMCFIFV